MGDGSSPNKTNIHVEKLKIFFLYELYRSIVASCVSCSPFQWSRFEGFCKVEEQIIAEYAIHTWFGKLQVIRVFAEYAWRW